MLREARDHGMLYFSSQDPGDDESLGSIFVELLGAGGYGRSFYGKTFNEAAANFWCSEMGVLKNIFFLELIKLALQYFKEKVIWEENKYRNSYAKIETLQKEELCRSLMWLWKPLVIT